MTDGPRTARTPALAAIAFAPRMLSKLTLVTLSLGGCGRASGVRSMSRRKPSARVQSYRKPLDVVKYEV